MTTSSQAALRAAATGSAVAKKEPQSFPHMLEQFKPQIAAALPKHLSADRMTRIALTCFRQTPKLGECEPLSVFAAVIMGAQLGLEPGILGQSYLIPYGKTCQFVPGWRGLQDLVNRSGRASTWTGAVYDGDFFEYELGDRPYLKHKPAGNDDQPDKLLYCYAIGRVKGAEFPVIEVWSRAKIERHRDRFNKVGRRHYSYENFEMYGRKVALLQVIKYMPTSIELATAVALESAAESGAQSIGLKDAIDGAFAPTPAPDQAEQPEQAPAAPTADAALAALRAEKTVDGLDRAWQAIKDTCSAANASIPIEVEAAYHDRREALAMG